MAQIKHSNTNEILFELKDADLKETIEKAVKEGANLNLANLEGANLVKANLEGANLNLANLNAAYLNAAYLNAAYLNAAYLDGTNLNLANLEGAHLKEANLSGANLNGVNLDGAHLERAILSQTILCGIDFRKALNLELTIHGAPSRISTDSFVKSNGEIPEAFLRQVGLSPWEIESVKLYNSKLSTIEITDIVYNIDSLRNENPIQIHNLFISYSRSDSLFVDNIESYFVEKNIRFWRDVHDAPAGPLEKILVREMENRIVLLVLSKKSVNSDWVEFEINRARKLEKKLGRHVICPIALDDSWNDNDWSDVLLDQVKKYNILDFSNWANKSFMDSKFKRLVQGLDLYYKKEKN